MVFDTHRTALASLREFAPWMRARHKIVRFWSHTHNRYRYTRIFVP